MESRTLLPGYQAANQLAEALNSQSLRVVFAESCTCGMAAALLGSIPGISNHFCGSSVTYRVATKAGWLGLDPTRIAEQSAESLKTTMEMAIGVLRSTPEAIWSAAITGDLGPNAGETDGLIYVCIARVKDPMLERLQEEAITVTRRHSIRLKTSDRISRQVEAASILLQQLDAEIRGSQP